jgi:hypothetical protein
MTRYEEGLLHNHDDQPIAWQVRVLDEKTRGPSTMVAHVHKGGVTGLISVCSEWEKNMFVTSGRDGLVRLWKPDHVGDGSK